MEHREKNEIKRRIKNIEKKKKEAEREGEKEMRTRKRWIHERTSSRREREREILRMRTPEFKCNEMFTYR